ncbi:MAG: hypothetical protein ACLPTJ_10425 [Solirubrobacteraceae bacterium]
MVKRASWLSVTPEPERELPEAVATLAAGRRARPDEVVRERTRVEQLVLHGTQRRWLAYLHEVVGLIDAGSASGDPDVALARERARAVIANHHNLLLALPGRGAAITADDRVALETYDNHERGPG